MNLKAKDLNLTLNENYIVLLANMLEQHFDDAISIVNKFYHEKN